MSQHDYVIDNASGATVRADINSALSAIQSLNSGSSAPSSTAAGMLWLDTTGGVPYALKVRDAGNNHWLTLANVTDPGSDGNLSVAAIEGTAILSTGESGGTKFLREDGDGTCSFQVAIQTGQPIQVQSTSITDSLSISPGGSFVDITGLSVQITPSSTSNKVMFFASVQGGSLTNVYAFLRVARTISSTTEAVGIGDARGSRSRVGAGFKESTNFDIESANWQFLDSPNTTSQITYKVQGIANGVLRVNHNANDGDDISNPTAISTITVMEIKQ